MPEDGELLIHGTCVALGERAALLRGKPGSGKSDLALRFVSAFARDGAMLVGDDQVEVRRAGGRLRAAPAPNLAGLLEVRGVGIVSLPHAAQADLVLIIELARGEAIARMPPEPLPCEDVLGVSVPVLALDAFEASAAAKLKIALGGAV